MGRGCKVQRMSVNPYESPASSGSASVALAVGVFASVVRWTVAAVCALLGALFLTITVYHVFHIVRLGLAEANDQHAIGYVPYSGLVASAFVLMCLGLARTHFWLVWVGLATFLAGVAVLLIQFAIWR
jgi:hypothetical protein